jgi:hypothetical protein
MKGGSDPLCDFSCDSCDPAIIGKLILLDTNEVAAYFRYDIVWREIEKLWHRLNCASKCAVFQ